MTHIVTQADREAASQLYLLDVGEPKSMHDLATSGEISFGNYDHWDIVQAFASHRTASEKAQRERDAAIAENCGYMLDIDEIMAMTKAESAARACVECAKAIRDQGND